MTSSSARKRLSTGIAIAVVALLSVAWSVVAPAAASASTITVVYTEYETAVGNALPLVLGQVSSVPEATILSEPTGLPPGTVLSLDSGEMRLVGRPTAGGSYTISAQVGHAGEQVTFERDIIVNEAPIIAPAVYGPLYPAVGVEMTPIDLTHAGYPAPTFSGSNLPPGLGVSADGVLSGTPTVAGHYDVEITATNALGSTTRPLVVYTGHPPALVFPESVEWYAGVPTKLGLFSHQYGGSVRGAPWWSGLGYGEEFVELTGVPVLAGGLTEQSGVLTATAYSYWGETTQSLNWTVRQPAAPVFSVPENVSATLGESLNIPVDVTSVPDATVTTGELPAGLTWLADETGGRLVGTPSDVGTWVVELTASNGMGEPVTTSITIEVTLPVITVATNAASVEQGHTVEVSASGFQPGEVVEAWLHSEPLLLGTGTAGPDGTFAALLTVPQSVEPGAHTLVVQGGTGATASLALTVTAAVPGDTSDPDDTDGGDGAEGTDGTGGTDGTDGAGGADDVGGASPDTGPATSATGNESGLAATGSEPGALIAVSLLVLAAGALLVRRVRY